MTKSNNSQSSHDQYKQLKRKLREAQKLNSLLSKDYYYAQKKIRTLTFEKGLLLEGISRMSHYNSIRSSSSSDQSPPQSDSSDDDDDETPAERVTSTHDPQLATVASAPPKRSKINPVNVRSRRVQPIERDSQGQPILPQQIGVLTVVSLGKIISNRTSFHNERYIFPVGYTVKRTYHSMIDPHSSTVITSTIIDGGDGPKFQITAADQPEEVIVANSATGAWSAVVRKSNEIRQRDHSNSASGPDYYGFKHPTIAKMIQDLPGTRDLKNYMWQSFEEMEPRAAKGVMAAAEKKRDNLEQLGHSNPNRINNNSRIGIPPGPADNSSMVVVAHHPPYFMRLEQEQQEDERDELVQSSD